MGHIKPSFYRSLRDKVDYYAVKSKRSGDSLRRQSDRCVCTMREHYRLVEELMTEHPTSLIYRVHLMGDSNATADHADVLALVESKLLSAVLGELHH